MMMEKMLSRSVRLICAGGVVMGMQAATAQQVNDAAPVAEKVTKIEITGSRIPMANIEGASPITTIGAAEIKADGVRNTESLLNNLPQVFANQGATVSNGASGTATVDLRGLGAARTLVLVNGHRMPAGSPLNTAADLNQIPAGLIKRVEILTGGAAAVYGSDAISGVVNFIMNDKFEGVQVEVNQSGFNHKQGSDAVANVIKTRAQTNPGSFKLPGDKSYDAKSMDFSLLVGGNFDHGKGNATLFASYKKDDALYQSQRDFSSCSLGANAAGYTCGGSSTSFPGRFILDSGAGSSLTVADANGNTRPYKAATDQYNFGPANLFQRPDERYVFNASVNYEINEKAKVYMTLASHDDHTKSEIAPSGAFGLTVPLNYENPLLSADWKNKLGLVKDGDTSTIALLRRNTEGGGRIAEFNGNSFRGLVGFKGDIGAWNYDVYAQTAKVTYAETDQNYFLDSKTLRALDVVSGPGGVPTCRSVVDGSDPACVPYNIFKLGAVTPAALSYLNTPALRKGTTEQHIYGATVVGDLGEYGIKSPMAGTGVGVNLGVERRVEKLAFINDANFQSGNLAGSGGPSLDTAGQYSVKEIFGEVRVPLIEKRPFAEYVAVNGTYRHSDYDTKQKAESFGFGLEWAPVKQVRLRSGYQRAVRAANINELFTPQGIGLFNMATDPCATDTPTASAAACARTGVTAAQYGKVPDSSAGQFNSIAGGNPNLAPEKADTYTLGLVLTPIENLSMTIDAFSIGIKGVIGSVPPTTAITNCLASGDPTFCSLIHRDAVGSLWLSNNGYVLANSVNLGSLKETGMDLGANYSYRLPAFGKMDFSYVGTIVKTLETEPLPGQGKYDCKGFYGATCGTPTPAYRHKMRANWSSQWNTELSLTWRHIDKVKVDGSSSNPQLTASFQPLEAELAARNYIDMALSWAVTKQWTVSGGINNLFDKDPPITTGGQSGAPFGNGNTFPGVYDTFGRKLFVSLTGKF